MHNTNVPPDVPPEARRLWLAVDAEIEGVLAEQELLHEALGSCTHLPIDDLAVADLSITHDGCELLKRFIEEMST